MSRAEQLPNRKVKRKALLSMAFGVGSVSPVAIGLSICGGRLYLEEYHERGGLVFGRCWTDGGGSAEGISNGPATIRISFLAPCLADPPLRRLGRRECLGRQPAHHPRLSGVG